MNMTKYKTNQASIDKGILKELINDYWSKFNNGKEYWHCEEKLTYMKYTIVKIDNRIKGYCLKEVK